MWLIWLLSISVWFVSHVWLKMLNLGGTDGEFNVIFFRRCWAPRLRAVTHFWPRWHIWRGQCLHRNSQFGCVCKICFEDDLSAGEDNKINVTKFLWLMCLRAWIKLFLCAYGLSYRNGLESAAWSLYLRTAVPCRIQSWSTFRPKGCCS